MRLEDGEVLGAHELVERAALECGPVEVVRKPAAVDRHAAELAVEHCHDGVGKVVDQRLVAGGGGVATRRHRAARLAGLQRGRASGRGKGVERRTGSCRRRHWDMCRLPGLDPLCP